MHIAGSVRLDSLTSHQRRISEEVRVLEANFVFVESVAESLLRKIQADGTYKISLLVAYGSFVCGEPTPYSDVDFIAVTLQGRFALQHFVYGSTPVSVTIIPHSELADARRSADVINSVRALRTGRTMFRSEEFDEPQWWSAVSYTVDPDFSRARSALHLARSHLSKLYRLATHGDVRMFRLLEAVVTFDIISVLLNVLGIPNRGYEAILPDLEAHGGFGRSMIDRLLATAASNSVRVKALCELVEELSEIVGDVYGHYEKLMSPSASEPIAEPTIRLFP